MLSRRRPPAAGRVLRVAELIDADPAAVRRLAAGLPDPVTASVVELPAGTLLTLEQRLPWWDRRPRTTVLAGLDRTLRDIERQVHRRTVVAAALIRDATLLIAQRARPAALAGQWEFPGGKVERGESARAALVRECREELGCQVVVGDEIGRQVLPDGALFILFQATLAAGSPDPAALEHRQLRWARAAELADLDWVATNRIYVTDVTTRL
ncbi:(deoxy)nucleoside triphosphate pyrophosphohydrolase [Jatrophihabitans sp.]|uniref:(deoxy)nucleoside triphosphate pyrophosphohydrolase n=1 Tax=Jatrophihabitans sp. TaxID=1932789 RepID=UPI002D014704|nr:(deoxy)nucleoside triphosphate pyrophosphohydrolase [Jatrophihabitans sp.]